MSKMHKLGEKSVRRGLPSETDKCTTSKIGDFTNDEQRNFWKKKVFEVCHEDASFLRNGMRLTPESCMLENLDIMD